MILDTNFLIALTEGEPSAFEKASEIWERGEIPFVPTPVLMEMEYGAAYIDSDDDRRKIRNILRMYPPVQLDSRIARRAGQLLARADRAAGGESGIGKIDPMVAAVADFRNDTVLTKNVDDFAALGVDIERW